MPRFKYTAKSEDGRVIRSELIAEDFSKAQMLLSKEGLRVSALQEIEATGWLERTAMGYLEKHAKPNQISNMIQKAASRSEQVKLREQPSSVVCGWCESEHAMPLASKKCDNCGGELPTLGEDRGERPPSTPRQLPPKFPRKLKWGNANYKVGLIFILVGIPFIPFLGFGLIFSGLGWWLFKKAKTKIEGRLRALEFGEPTKGNITAVYRDTTVKINGRSPFKVEYEFDGRGGTRHADFKTTWNAGVLSHSIGEPIWVVYIPEDPSQSDLWPPLA